MENYREDAGSRMHGGTLTPDGQEAKRLRNQLVEYDGYLQEMRKSNMKNVETLDVIQRYTNKSSSGIQALTEESAAGMQKLAEESLQGIQKLAQECAGGLKRYAATSEEGMSRLGNESMARFVQFAENSLQRLESVAQEAADQIQALTEESLNKIREVNERNIETAERSVETAERVEEIRDLMAGQMEYLRSMQKETDEFTHKENVKVYRNVQAVVVGEVKKQTDELKRETKGMKPLLIITLLFTLANMALFLLQILGILGI